MTDHPPPGGQPPAVPIPPPSRGIGINLEAPMTNDPRNDSRARLEALRDRLEAVLADPGTVPRDLASVSREYRMTLDKLAEMKPSTGTSALDEIAARRQNRGAS